MYVNSDAPIVWRTAMRFSASQSDTYAQERKKCIYVYQYIYNTYNTYNTYQYISIYTFIYMYTYVDTFLGIHIHIYIHIYNSSKYEARERIHFMEKVDGLPTLSGGPGVHPVVLL